MPGTSTKSTRFTLRIPNDLLAELDREAEARKLSVAAVMLERIAAAPARVVAPPPD